MPETPFSLSPNPNTLHLTAPLRSTVYRMRYTIDHRQGLAALLGDVGLGKSTILRYLWADYAARPDHMALFLPTSQFPSPFAMARHIAVGLGVQTARSLVGQRELMEHFLVERYAAGVNVVLFLDEAQLLTADCLELVRTLLNFELKSKLVQIVLAGQLDLRDRLRTAKFKALRSRIFAPCVLNCMTCDEMVGMLETRCSDAGIAWPFTPDAIAELYDYSGGVPRTALRIAAMAYGFAQSSDGAITAELIHAVIGQDSDEAASATAA